MSFKLLLPCLCLFVLAQTGIAQNKSEIIEKGISVKKTYKQDLDDGDDEFWIDEEKYFNKNGDLVEYKEYADKGDDIKVWEKYKYNHLNELIEKTEYSENGEQKKRIEFKYENGLNTERWYYDERDRLYEKRKYTYEFRN